ncbi:MAG: hypothetical protein GF393_04480, partial [Armatimonadia bacterium]|nr:hypothetical protein [Armatimonadia bacterium]
MQRIGMFAALIALAAVTCHAQPTYVGDYDAELRDGDHVDCELMVERLQELGANTYMWLIWHSENDWADLHEFLPLADEAGITVWVYLVPPTETPAVNPDLGFPYSEPFRLDYTRWAEEIAKLSLEHDNLVGYVIDDFWGNVNPDWFTPETIAEMIQAGREINPEIKFYPLMYYRQIGARFAERLGPLVDGVVAAYPRDRETVERALRFLRDDYAISEQALVSHPWDTPSRAGDYGFLSATAEVTDHEDARLRFSYTDDFVGATAGYHFMQARIDGETVWEEDVAGDDDGFVEVDLTDHVADREEVTVSFGIRDRTGVGNFGVMAGFPKIEAAGINLPPMDEEGAWQVDVQGAFRAQAVPAAEGRNQFELPLIVMPSGSRGAYQKRNGEEATP